MPLPTGDPTDLNAVKAQLTIGDDVDDVRLTPYVLAVNVVVSGLPKAARLEQDPPLDEWPADLRLGAAMLGARLWRRRSSPDGIAAFSDQGAIYIQRNDPDIAMLLGLGAWGRPAVG